MSTPLTLTGTERPDGTPVLTAAGEIDMSNTGAFADALAATPGRVVVDLTAVGYLDSAALTVLFDHAGRIEIVAAPLLIPVLTISGLGDVATVHESATGAPAPAE
ncbi:STAS domain-containing protein [Actinomadura opuntiae]|uniref:STAS domain-containing protein n=1 Tax=Actinomadura sp. OS1-43 TaxID=604315 RepID=UPI00255AB42D|nr:STAS domain-containing protein [Actinomadura sp. OS1-43]MDL4814256.1 STAS domain-containing protein [Actinomadura sp. OS1-43]